MNPKSVALTTHPRLAQFFINFVSLYQAVCEGYLILFLSSEANN